MKTSEALRIVDKLKAAYPRQVIGRETLQIYAEALADLDGDLLRRVATDHIRSERWFPTIAALREHCADLVSGLPPATAIAVALSSPGAKLHPLVRLALIEAIGSTWSYDYQRSERPGLLLKNATAHYRELRREEIRALQVRPARMLEALKAARPIAEIEGGLNA